LSPQSQKVAHGVQSARIAGFCIYVAAFFLPACRQVSTPGVLTPDVYRGWFCAWVTLMNTFSGEVWHSKDFLAILSGWIKPLILFYLVFLIRPRMVWTRRIMGGAIMAFMGATWIYFWLVPLVPLIGHVLWIAGILMMLADEAFGHEPFEFIAPGPRTQSLG
jgi:hypothetical protein